tara:strand:+ start:46 stop:483 length:438 start_codon:yes stop_codon:yes gene_type:complete
MARKKETVQIDGHSVEIYQLPVPISLKVMTRLLKILGKPLGAIVGHSGINGKQVVEKVLDSKINLELVMGHLADGFDEDIVISTIEMFLPYMHIDGKQVKSLESFDDLGIGVLLKSITAALRVNYNDFFGGLLDAGANAMTPTES